jgi:hypothetical protein
MWIRLSVGQDGFSKKVLNMRKRKMSNRKTEIKTVDQCHREGRKEGRKEGHGRGGGGVSGRERDSEAWLLDDPHTVLMLKEVEQDAVFFGMGYFVGCFVVGCKQASRGCARRHEDG